MSHLRDGQNDVVMVVVGRLAATALEWRLGNCKKIIYNIISNICMYVCIMWMDWMSVTIKMMFNICVWSVRL